MEDKATNIMQLQCNKALFTVDQSKLANERSKLERMCQQFNDKLGCVKPFRLFPEELKTEYKTLRKSKEIHVRLFAILLLGISTKCRDTFLLSRRIMNDLINNAPVRDCGIGQQTYNGFISMLLSYGILVCLEKPTRNRAGSYKLVNEIYASLAIDESQLIEKIEVQTEEFENYDCGDSESNESVDVETKVDVENKVEENTLSKNKAHNVKANVSSIPDNKTSGTEAIKPPTKTYLIYNSLKRHLNLVKATLKEETSPLAPNFFNHGVADDPDMSKYFDGIVVDWFGKINKELNLDTKLSLYKTFASTIVGEWKSYEGLKSKDWEPNWVFKAMCRFRNHHVRWFITPKGEHLNRPVSYLYAIVKANWKER